MQQTPISAFEATSGMLYFARMLDKIHKHAAGELRDDILIWNHFVTKLGWNDQVTELLEQRKAESGLIDHNEIATMLEYFEYDEGRKS